MTTRTKKFSSPVFAITCARRTYAYICAETPELALMRAAQIKREIELPMLRAGVAVEAKLVKEGFLSGAPWYSDGFFRWQDELADDLAAGNTVCPVCGR